MLSHRRDNDMIKQMENAIFVNVAHIHALFCSQDNEALYIWCHTQRKKFRDQHPSLTNDKISMLNEIDFVWDLRPRKSKTTYGTSNSTTTTTITTATTSMAMDEIKNQEDEKDMDGLIMMEEEPTESCAPNVPPTTSGEAKTRASLKGLDSRQEAAGVAAEDDGDDDENDAEDTAVVDPPPPIPNMGFFEKSLGGAAWVADGAKSLLKMFVAF